MVGENKMCLCNGAYRLAHVSVSRGAHHGYAMHQRNQAILFVSGGVKLGIVKARNLIACRLLPPRRNRESRRHRKRDIIMVAVLCHDASGGDGIILIK